MVRLSIRSLRKCSISIYFQFRTRYRHNVNAAKFLKRVIFESKLQANKTHSYPLQKEVVPIWLAAFLGSMVPILFILLMQIRIRSFWDANNAIIGLLYSLITAAVFQVWLKWLIGGLRPHFLAVCQPQVKGPGTGFVNIMYDRSVCTGTDEATINDSLESFPSVRAKLTTHWLTQGVAATNSGYQGHTTAAFAGFVYLYLYLNAKLKIWSNYHPAMWKLIIVYAPILGATLIGGALTIDHFHNWYDIVAGAIIGTVMAFSAYRMVYASVWDFRFNHVPLTRHTPFSYGMGGAGAGGFDTAVFTRKAGWGMDEGVFGGAPFDAAGGMTGGFGGGGAGMSGTTTGREPINRRPVPGGHSHGDHIV